MPTDPLPPTDDNQVEFDPQLEAEDEALSSGNTRLGLIVGALFALGLLAYVLAPKPEGSVLASVTPTFMLEGAAVTATSAAPEATPATAPAAAETAALSQPKPVAPAVAPAAAVAVAARPATPVAPAAPAPEAVAPAPEPVAEPVAESAKPSTVTVTGRILDEDGKPLAGATVLLKGSGRGTGTDANGNYSLEIPAGDNVLSIGYGGYRDEEIRTRDGKPVNMTLTPTPGVKRRKK